MGGGNRRGWCRKEAYISLNRICLSSHHPYSIPSASISWTFTKLWHCAKQCRTNDKNDSFGSQDLTVQWGRQLHKQIIIIYCDRYALEVCAGDRGNMEEEVANSV